MSNKVKKEIFNAVSENVKALEQLFPSVVKDGQVDFDALKQELGKFEEVGTGVGNEKYEFVWNGKAKAKAAAQTDIAGRTLRYKKGDGVNEDTTQNIYIEGDNLEALKLLRNSYYNRIKMIYIDPPYNTDGDFVYRDNSAMTECELRALEEAQGDIDENGKRLVKNSKDAARYHTNWCNMIYPRLRIARDLLTDDGVILINIDEHELINLSKICVEVFGPDNDLGTIIWDKRNPKGDAKGISYQHEYILVFAKNKEALFSNNFSIQRLKKNAELMLRKAEQIFKKTNMTFSLDDANKEFRTWVASQNDLSGGEKAYNRIDENGNVYRPVSMAWPNNKKAPDDYFIPLIHPITNKPCPVPQKGWRNPPATMRELRNSNLLLFGVDETTQPNRKYLLKDNLNENIPSLLYYGGSDTDLLSELEIPFDTPKVVNIIKDHIYAFTKKDDIILDFFSGSATVAHAAMQLNAEIADSRRKYIMVQFQETTYEIIDGVEVPKKNETSKKAYEAGYKNICEIGKERIRRAGAKIAEDNRMTAPNLDIGFKVFRVADTNIKMFSRELNGENLLDGTQIDTEYLTEQQEKFDFNAGFTDIDVCYELLLRHRGIPLSSKIEKLPFAERSYIVADSIVVCIDQFISETLVEQFAAIEPLPLKFIFRDSAFNDDISLKENTMNYLNTLIKKNNDKKNYTKTYKVEFI